MLLDRGRPKEAERLGVKFLGSGLKRLFVADRNYFLKVTIDRFGQKVYVSFYNLQVGFATNYYTTRSG